ncbi:MAG: sulfatase-like hydrolase/transferase, partial [Longimicrobiales bacterium]
MLASLLLPSVLCLGCGGPAPLTVDMPLHLEDHLDAATIVGSEVPAELPQRIEWRFDEAQPDWKAAVPLQPSIDPVQLTRTEDALRLTLTEANGPSFTPPTLGGRRLSGGMYIDLPDWRREDWAYVLVRARTSDEIATTIGLRFNLRGEPTPIPWRQGPFLVFGDFVDVIHDGSVQTYLLQADRSLLSPSEGPWRQLGIALAADEPASIDILSVSFVPKEATFADAPVGVRAEARNEAHRRSLYMHTPGRLEYRVQVPEAGRLDVGLGVLRADAPVTFRITAGPAGGEAETVFEETYADQEEWAQRSVDLSKWVGQTVQLALEADADRAGTVALWAAPTLTGAGGTEKPNVVFYVIDGAGADFMSVYGYNRRTTPNLERLAAQGAVFEHAYSNSAWTKPSTASFMTSLHHSVLGGFGGFQDPLPDQAVTMAQHFHRHGYQTGVFT